MQHNILRDSNVTKIYLMYIDGGARKKIQVKLRFMDSKEGYFAAPTPRGFVKPKRKIPAELNVYTTEFEAIQHFAKIIRFRFSDIFSFSCHLAVRKID